MEVETMAEQLFFTTALVSGKSPTGDWTGTGFAYAVGTDKGSAHFLVTNKHVLSGASEVTVRMVRADNQKPALGAGTQITVQKFSDEVWTGHSDPRVDVAVMPLSTILEEMARAGAPAFFRSVGPPLLLTRGGERQLDAMEEVVFIGYPSGLFDTHNLTPIARRGLTATPVGIDYQGVPAFLIDASVFPGSSGSPVFVFDRGMYQERGGGTVVGSRLLCVGVLAAVHVRQVEGNIVDLPARRVAVMDQPLNLGIVYKAETIEACVDVILNRAGLERLPSPAMETATETSQADEQIAEATD